MKVKRPFASTAQQQAADALLERLRGPLKDAGISEIVHVVIGDDLILADGDARHTAVVPEIATRQPESQFLRATLHRLGVRGLRIGVREQIVYATISVKRNRV